MRYAVSFEHDFFVDIEDDLDEVEIDAALKEAVADELANMALPEYDASKAPRRPRKAPVP